MLRWLTRQYYSKTILPILSCQITAAAAFQQLVSVSLLHMLLHLLLERWERAELDLLGCVAKLPLESEAWRHKHPAIVKQGEERGPQARGAHRLCQRTAAHRDFFNKRGRRRRSRSGRGRAASGGRAATASLACLYIKMVSPRALVYSVTHEILYQKNQQPRVLARIQPQLIFIPSYSSRTLLLKVCLYSLVLLSPFELSKVSVLLPANGWGRGCVAVSPSCPNPAS